VGLGGEKLDRQGVVPDQVLRITETEDPLAKVLAALAAPAPVAKTTTPTPAAAPAPKEVPPSVKKPLN
jgi:hypothetical protein